MPDASTLSHRWRLLALLLAAATAGCTAGPAHDSPAPSSPSTTTSVALGAAGSSPARPIASSSPSTRSVSSTPSSTTSSARAIAPVSAEARAAGLLDVRTVVPDAIVDLRYATSNNFVGVRLYQADARCLVHESMAAGLTAAAKRLRSEGDVLVFWDCYRPHAVQVRMFQIVPDPNWVARPGPYATSHEAARSVDVTLARAGTGGLCPSAQRVQQHCLLDMGTGFDDFSPRAWAFATDGVSSQAQADRARLRTAMNAGGITVYRGEWWHFDGPGASVERPHLNAPLS